jgi:predicted nucleotidyltransferase
LRRRAHGRTAGRRSLEAAAHTCTFEDVLSLARTSLDPKEQRALERLTRLVEEEFGSHLVGLWLYGSRARGEPPSEDSDVDLLLVSSRGRRDDDLRAIELAFEAAEAEGLNPMLFSIKLYSPERLAQRRSIESFFIQEVDRDKIVLAGKS